MGGGAVVLLVLAMPLWRGNYESGRMAWNIILAAMLIIVVVAAIMLQRFFMVHIDEIGEARFDTSNRDGENG